MTDAEREMRRLIADAAAKGELPAPLTPPDSDVHTFPAFMVDASRLMASEFFAAASAEAKGAALSLWVHAWRQSPPASIPNDPTVWSRVTDLTRRRLKSLTDIGVGSPLHGFVLCSDGRLYHPTLAADALRAQKVRQKRQEAAEKAHRRKILSDTSGRFTGRGRTAWNARD